MGRRLLIALVALLLGAQVVRNAAVAALVDRAPTTAVRIWPGAPDAEIATAMVDIGRAAAVRRPAPAYAFAQINAAAANSPLAPEPFLVRGVQAQVVGNGPLALAAFRAAERRDPRSLPARYFLAGALFRSGDATAGLQQAAVLARLAPNGVGDLAPSIAAYASNRSTWPRLRALFRSSPDLQETTLATLARDPANADVVLALADDSPGVFRQNWAPILLNGLVGAGKYGQAYAVWASAAHERSAPGTLHDPSFRQPSAPPPFNWVLTASTVGLAERRSGGGLRVIFYGRQDGVLVRQLLLLAPGGYRLTLSVADVAGKPRALTWSLRCDRTQTPFAAIPLDVAVTRGWLFSVPADCPAQWLELSGVSPEIPQQTALTIREMRLTTEPPRG